jgi:hypothetical protein
MPSLGDVGGRDSRNPGANQRDVRPRLGLHGKTSPSEAMQPRGPGRPHGKVSPSVAKDLTVIIMHIIWRSREYAIPRCTFRHGREHPVQHQVKLYALLIPVAVIIDLTWPGLIMPGV